MMRRSLILTALILIFSSTIFAVPPQQKDTTDLKRVIAYTAELESHFELIDYVYELYLRYGEKKIPEEKYLISLMNLVNREVSRRLKDPKEARQQYFKDLQNILVEIQQLKGRLRAANIRELDTFISNLESRIKYTIEDEEINFKKKKVFEDALQMLYVSEEMIKLDKTESPAEITQKISRSKEKLLSAFDEVTPPSSSDLDRKPTIYDLFVEWKKTDQVKYSRRLADVKLARKNLLKSSGLEEISRMFNDQLKMAYFHFNFGDYGLTELLLNDLIDVYPNWGVKQLDDVYFYRAECNFALSRFMHARENYEALLSAYPSTSYLPQVYSRLVQINYSLNNYSKAIEYGSLYQTVAPSANKTFYDIQFLMAMSFYQLGNYDRTVEALLNIAVEHEFYELAQYFIGNAYAAAQLYDDAIQAYLQLIENKGTPRYLHARSLYKMGILEYERQHYLSAINYLERIPEGYSGLDKVLNALAWAHFEYQRSKPVEEVHDFSAARFYAQQLVDQYFASPYRMEASSLLAYINQLVNEPREAIDLYRNVYQTKVKRGEVKDYLAEKKHLKDLYDQALAMKREALQSQNSKAYIKATDLLRRLDRELETLEIAESSGPGVATLQELKSVVRQIKELNALRLQAEESGNKKAIEKIDSLQIRLAAALELFPEDIVARANSINLFDAYPVSKYVEDEASRHEEMLRNRQQIQEDMAKIDQGLRELQKRINRAKVEKDFSLVARLEDKYDDLEILKKKYDQLLVATYEIDTEGNPYPEFSKWGDVGAFGIMNVYFGQKQRMHNRLIEVANVLSRVNDQLDQRKQVIEDKISKIESEIRFMTMKARMQERARLRAERERAFRESYFDTRESETTTDE